MKTAMKKWLSGATIIVILLSMITIMASCSKNSGMPEPPTPPPTVKITLEKTIKFYLNFSSAVTDNKSNLWLISKTVVFEINPNGLIKTDTISISNIGCIGDTIYGLIDQVGVVDLPENELLSTGPPLVTYLLGHPLKDLTTAEKLDSEYVIADAKYRSIALDYVTDGKDLFVGTSNGVIDMGNGEKIECKGRNIVSFNINNDTIYSLQYANQTIYGAIGNDIEFPISFSMSPNIMATNGNVIIQLDKEINVYNHTGLLLNTYVFNNESQYDYIVYSRIVNEQTIYCLFDNGDFYILKLET